MAESLKTVSLIEQLDESKRLFDDFVSREYAALARLKANSEFESATAEKEMEQLSAQKIALDARRMDMQSILGSKHEEIQVVSAQVAALKQTAETDLPLKISQKAAEVDAAMQGLEIMRKDLESKQAGRLLRKNELAKGVIFYKERLGLNFERMPDGSLSFRLTLLDPENHQRAFVFSVFVNSKNRYEVVKCEPKVDYEPLLAQLNESNNFSVFVQQMRRSFKALV